MNGTMRVFILAWRLKRHYIWIIKAGELVKSDARLYPLRSKALFQSVVMHIPDYANVEAREKELYMHVI